MAKAAFHTFSTFWLRQIDQLQYQRTPRDNAHTTWQEVSTHNILQYRTFASRLATNDNYLWKIDTLATSTVENILQLVDNWYQLLHGSVLIRLCAVATTQTSFREQTPGPLFRCTFLWPIPLWITEAGAITLRRSVSEDSNIASCRGKWLLAWLASSRQANYSIPSDSEAALLSFSSNASSTPRAQSDQRATMEGDHLAGLCINTIRALRFSTTTSLNSDIFC